MSRPAMTVKHLAEWHREQAALAELSDDGADRFGHVKARKKFHAEAAALLSAVHGGHSLRVGDLVSPAIGHGPLRSGASHYERAVVVNLNPFVLVSEGCDMRWEATVRPEHFVKVGRAGWVVTALCLRRIKR